MRVCPECGVRSSALRCTNCDEDTMPVETSGTGPDPLVGQLFAGRFRVLRLIGQGGMGAVYAAQQVSMQREVALKVLTAPTSDAQAVRRFYREVKATSRLRHPHTIRVYDYGTDEHGRQFLAMELLTGESLAALLAREGRLTPQRVVRIAGQVAKALGEAHAAGLVHRDLKPDNIFLRTLYGESDYVTVLDFGIARFTDPHDTTSSLTSADTTVGTADYMSPEQVLGRPLDGRSDLFALGVVLYECLTGRLPFKDAGRHGFVSAALARVERDARPLVGEDGPDPLRRLIMNLLQRNPDDRPRNAAVLLERLAPLADWNPVDGSSAEIQLAATGPTVPRAPRVPRTRLAAGSATARAGTAARAARWRIVAIGLGLVLAAATVFLPMLWPGSTPKPIVPPPAAPDAAAKGPGRAPAAPDAAVPPRTTPDGAGPKDDP